MGIITTMKTVLVTGSNGLLGQKLTEKILAENRCNLIATAKGGNRYPLKSGYIYAEMDILNPKQVKAVIEQYRPDAIIHTAAMTNVDTCHENQEACTALNVEATENLVSICASHQIQFIYISTDFVFDGLNGPYLEDDLPNPLSFYGHSKLQAENLVKASTAPWVILRTILVYGVIKDGSRSNIVLWAKNALTAKTHIKVVNDQWRMPTLAEDLAEACLLAIEKNAKGVFHISGRDYLSIVDIVRAVAKFWKLDSSCIQEVSSKTLNQTAQRPINTGFVLDKAIAVLGYQPHSFTEGLALLDAQLKELKL